MPAYVSTTVFENGSSVIDAIKTLNSLGIENIEAGSIHNYEEGLEANLKENRSKVITHNFFPPSKNRLILNIASENEEIRDRSLEYIKNSIDFALSIGAELYTVHPGFLSDPLGESTDAGNYDFMFKANADITDNRYRECFDNFIISINKIARYVQGKSIKIAVETQGAVDKKNLVLLARPEEIVEFLDKCQSEQVGINLNLGHLNLAANAWKFNRIDFVAHVKPRLMAIEVTHNEGVHDDHAPLKENSWYMRLLKEDCFKNIPVIFEGRNISKDQIMSSYNLLKCLHSKVFK